MATKPHSDDTLRAVLAAVEAHGGVSQAATALGQSYGTFQSRYRAAIARFGKPKPKAADSPVLTDSFSATGDNAELTKGTHEDVRSLDDLVRVCSIDTSEWEVERFVCNKWAVGAKNNDGELISMPLYQVKAWLKRKRAIVDAKQEIAQLVSDAKRGLPSLGRKAPKRAKSGYLLEINIADLHNGKLAWGKETGHGNYDGATAESLHDAAVETILQRTSAYRFDEILIVVGNDLLHVDSRSNTTTGGTPQDTDSRYYKTFLSTRRMIQRAIEKCRKLAPVRAVLVPGNHDRDSVWHLGESLVCWYHDCADVVIDNEPKQRKYVEFGRVMLLLTHGDKGKRADYPLLMATEQPAMFGRTVYREAHTGHLHQTQVQEWHGVRVRILPSLAGADAWHAENAYVGNLRAAEAFVWGADEGLVATAYYTVPGDVLAEGAA